MTTVTYTTAGTNTWVCPAGVTSVSVECWGGGGGGGLGDFNDVANAGGGGGGGEYAAALANTCVPGDSYTVVVGAAGTAGTAGAGGAGGSSSFTGTGATTVTAHGGGGGLSLSATGGAAGTGSANSVHHNGGAGGAGAASGNGGGSGGGSGGSSAVGNSGATGSSGGTAGATAVTGGGPGGKGGPTSGAGSVPVSGPGGGGGGGSSATTNHNGAAGFAGQVVLTYTSPLLLNNLEGGTSATAVSAANSGGTSGDAFDAVNIVTGGTLAYSNAQSAHGSLSMVAATGTTTTSGSYAQWGTSLGTVTTHYGRAYLYLSASPATTDALIEYLSAGTFRCGIQVTTGRQIQVQDAAFSFVHTFTAVIPTTQWVRVEWQVIFSATVGQAIVSYYASMDSATATETYTSAASQNFGASANQLQFGWNNGHASQPSVYFDDLGASTTGLLGPAGVAAAVSPLLVPGPVAVMRASIF